jgi:hypothetical protein
MLSRTQPLDEPWRRLTAPLGRNADYAQALALAGLLAGASLSLSRRYAGNQWLLPAWLTMAAALGLAALRPVASQPRHDPGAVSGGRGESWAARLAPRELSQSSHRGPP